MPEVAGFLNSPRVIILYTENYTRLIHRIKAKAPHIKVIYHSDGAIAPCLSRFVEGGADVAHPLEPPASDLAAIKAAFGDCIAFTGGIDIRKAMQEDGGRRRGRGQAAHQQLAAGGGYMLVPANHRQGDAPLRRTSFGSTRRRRSSVAIRWQMRRSDRCTHCTFLSILRLEQIIRVVYIPSQSAISNENQ